MSNFLISPRKHKPWILIRPKALLMSTHNMFSWRNNKHISRVPPFPYLELWQRALPYKALPSSIVFWWRSCIWISVSVVRVTWWWRWSSVIWVWVWSKSVQWWWGIPVSVVIIRISWVWISRGTSKPISWRPTWSFRAIFGPMSLLTTSVTLSFTSHTRLLTYLTV